MTKLSHQNQPGGSILYINSNRIQSLDLLRGLAACSVMVFHFTAESTIELSDTNPLRITGVYGHYGVDVFFILSGLVIPYSMYRASYSISSLGNFLLKRTIRLEIPFLALIALEVVAIYLSSLASWKEGVSERMDAFNILLHIGYLNGILDRPWLIPVFWTLAIEFQFYLLIGFIFFLLSTRNFAIRNSTLAALALLSFVIPHPDLFFRYGLLFLLGIVLFQLMCSIINPREFSFWSIVLFILVYFQHGSISFFLSVLTVTIIIVVKGEWRWSNFLGMISYSLYLVHIPFGGRLLMLTNMHVKSELIRSMLILGYLPLTIFAAWLFFLFFERPSVLLSKKISYKKT